MKNNFFIRLSVVFLIFFLGSPFMCANSWIDEPLWTSASPWSNDVLYHINSDLYIMYEPFQNNSYLNFDDPNTGGTSPGAVPINAGFITLIVMLLFYVLYKLSFVKSSHD